MFQAVFMCFSLDLVIKCGGGGGGGGSPKGRVHNLLMELLTVASSKIEVFETYFSDTVITQNDHPNYVKHFLGRIDVVFHPFWVPYPKGLNHSFDPL